VVRYWLAGKGTASSGSLGVANSRTGAVDCQVSEIFSLVENPQGAGFFFGSLRACRSNGYWSAESKQTPAAITGVSKGGKAMLRIRMMWVALSLGIGNFTLAAGQSQPSQQGRGLLRPGPSLSWVQGRQLLVQRRQSDGRLASAEAFKMRGVCYSPVDPGETVLSRADSRQHLRESRYVEDFRLIRGMRANTVKTYVDPGVDGAALQILDEAQRRGLWVLLSLDPDVAHDAGELPNAAIVQALKDHPALLGWIVGNEWNLNLFYHYPSVAAAQLDVELTVQEIQSLDPNHIVASSLGFLPPHYNQGPNVLGTELPSILAAVPSADLWGFNMYRGSGFDPRFLEWDLLAPTLPFFFGEFGTDDLATTDLLTGTGNVDEATQAATQGALWGEIRRHFSATDAVRACIGGCVFSWSDEWWKDPSGGTSAAVQDSGGFELTLELTDCRQGGVAATLTGHPDRYSNEEHYGLVDVDRNKKQAYFELRDGFALGAPKSEALQLTVKSQGGGSDAYFSMAKDGFPFALSYSGFSFPAGGRGINVAVLDRATGTVRSIDNYDTYGSPDFSCACLLADLAGVAEGDVVLVSVADTALPFFHLCSPMDSIVSLSDCVTALQSLGSQLESGLQYWQPYALISIAGACPTNLAEAVGSGSCSTGVYADVEIQTAVIRDADRDGLTDDADLDNDNDGVTDAIEAAQGSDALDPNDF
jgi:hypothetical protein